MQLKGRRVWLIGASSGIGAELTRDLAREGAVLAISARRLEKLNEVADATAGLGPRPLVVPLDVTDAAGVQTGLMPSLLKHGDTSTSSSTMPASGMTSLVEAFDADKAAEQVEVNLTGMMRAVATVLPDMVARRRARSSAWRALPAIEATARAIAYSASKAGAIAFLQALRLQLEPYSVGVTMINPGFIKTPLFDDTSVSTVFAGSAESASREIVGGLLGSKKEIHFPKRLSWTMKLVTALPTPLYEFISRRFM